MKPSNTTTSGKATDMIADICTFPRLPCPSTKRHAMLNLTSAAAAAAAAAAATALRTAGWSCSVFFSFSSNSLAKSTWRWMLYRTLRNVPGTTKVRLLLVGPARCFIFHSKSFVKAIWWWMLLYRTLRKVTCTNMRKKHVRRDSKV